jgi:hypothetical protein
VDRLLLLLLSSSWSRSVQSIIIGWIDYSTLAFHQTMRSSSDYRKRSSGASMLCLMGAARSPEDNIHKRKRNKTHSSRHECSLWCGNHPEPIEQSWADQSQGKRWRYWSTTSSKLKGWKYLTSYSIRGQAFESWHDFCSKSF